MTESEPSLWTRLRVLSVGDYARLCLASALLLTTWVGLSVGSFGRLRSVLLWFAERAARVIPGDPSATLVVWAIRAADRYLPGHRKCLMRSLAAETLLACYGYEPEHRIGVDPGGDEFEAHSWLEYEGDVLIGDLEDLSRYQPLPSLEDYGAL